MKKTKRILAGILGIAIILGLFLLYDAVNGDPVSESYAKSRAVAYAKKLYPGQSFQTTSVYYDPPFVYRIGVQSKDSCDTRFEVIIRHWTDISDELSTGMSEHERLVESGWNTCYRMGTEAAEEIGVLLADELSAYEFIPLYYIPDGSIVQIDLCFSSDDAPRTESSAAYREYLPMDQAFDKEILRSVPARLVTTIKWEQAPTEEDLQTALYEIRQIMETHDLPMAYYNVTLTLGDDKETILSSGDVAANEIG